MVNAGATAQMQEAWEQENTEQWVLWNQQVEADNTARDKADRVVQEQEDQEREIIRCEKDKKKLKLGDFDSNLTVGSHITPRPSTYALTKLKNFEYLEMYYFTIERCLYALNNQHSEASDAFGLTRISDSVGLRQVAAV